MSFDQKYLNANYRSSAVVLTAAGFQQTAEPLFGLDAGSVWRRASDGTIAAVDVRTRNIPVFQRDGQAIAAIDVLARSRPPGGGDGAEP